MDNEARITVLVASLARQIEWIKQADAKANVAFAFNTAMLGLLAAVSPKTLVAWSFLPGLFALAATGGCAYSLVCIGVTLFPRTWGPSNSLLYCGGIAQHPPAGFRQQMLCLTEDAYIEDLCNQTHRNAEIAVLKFKWVQKALFATFIAVVPWLLAVWMLYSGPARAP